MPGPILPHQPGTPTGGLPAEIIANLPPGTLPGTLPPPTITNPNPAPVQPRPPMPWEEFAWPVGESVPQTQIPPDLLAALLPSPSVTGSIPSAQQQQLALELMQTGKIFGLQGQQDFGNMTMSTLGGAPAFNPFARMPAANPFISNLPPEIQGLFDFAPMSFQSQPFVSQDVYPGQQIGNLTARAVEERERLQGMSDKALGVADFKGGKYEKRAARNQAIVDLLNQWGRSQGWEGNINDILDRYENGRGAGPLNPVVDAGTFPAGADPNMLQRPDLAAQGRTAEQAQSDLAPQDRLTPTDPATQADFGIFSGPALAAIIGGTVAAAGSVGGAAIQANQAKKSGKSVGKIPGVFRPATVEASNQLEQRLMRPSSTYMMPQVAPMSSFEIAALGQIANQALNPQYQAAPITRAPTIRPLTGG